MAAADGGDHFDPESDNEEDYEDFDEDDEDLSDETAEEEIVNQESRGRSIRRRRYKPPKNSVLAQHHLNAIPVVSWRSRGWIVHRSALVFGLALL
jgi:hypothetical protein